MKKTNVIKYQKPELKKVEGMYFMFESYKTSVSKITCRQCSGCHGCR